MTELHWTEVDGVTTIWAEAPEPLRACLMFRTGRVDETLVTTGQTHLIEHMVLSAVGGNPQISNGYVLGPVTGFYSVGSGEDVSAFLRRVCNHLQSLPAGRLEAEKKILLAEASSRHLNIHTDLLLWRFGSSGYGLIGMPEYGTRGATIEQLCAWSLQRFTRGNAVLWLSGPLPASLRLELPPGEKQPLPPLAPIQQAIPRWYVNDAFGGIAAGAIVPRARASSLFCQIVSQRIHERLRTEHALSYSPSVSYEPLNADTAHLVLFADSDRDHRVELAEAFTHFFESLNQVNVAEVDAARKLLLDTWTGPLAPPPSDQVYSDLHRAAMSWVLGREFESIEELAAGVSSVQITDVVELGAEVQKTAIFAIPSGVQLHPCMGKQAPLSVGPAVEGREVSHIDAPVRRERLVTGPEGVSILFPDGSHLTVRYAQLAAALDYEDGGFGLIGFDATWIPVEPTLWRNGLSICCEIQERVPAHLLLPQDPRPADAIPKPSTTAWQRFRAWVRQHGRPSGCVLSLIIYFCTIILIQLLSHLTGPQH